MHLDKEIWPKWKNRAKLQKELSDDEIGNLYDGEFKALGIKMLRELIELGHKMKDTQSEIKQNIQGTNSDRKKPGLQSTISNKWKK